MATQAVVAEMTDQQLQEHAFRVLSRELGLGGLARFIRLNLSGQGDYTADRHKWQEGLTAEQILADIKARRHANDAA